MNSPYGIIIFFEQQFFHVKNQIMGIVRKLGAIQIKRDACNESLGFTVENRTNFVKILPNVIFEWPLMKNFSETVII